MADINIERKGPKVWPWILGLLVLALVIWLLAEMMGGEEAGEPELFEDTTEMQAPMTPPPPAAPDTMTGGAADTI